MIHSSQRNCVNRVTESFLRTLARYRYPTVLSTRSSLVASNRYIAWLKEIGEHSRSVLILQFARFLCGHVRTILSFTE